MNVSMNGLRRQLLGNYNSLVNTLNDNISDDEVNVSTYEIQKQLDAIRSCIITLAFSYEDGNDDFTCMDDDTEFVTFNELIESE